MAVVDKHLYREIGTRIYNLRVGSGYSRQYMAEQLHISAKFLYEIENGRKGFTVQVLLHIAEIFNITCDYLVKGEESFILQPEKLAGLVKAESGNIGNVLELFDGEELDKIAVVLRAVYAVKDQKVKKSGSRKTRKNKNSKGTPK